MTDEKLILRRAFEAQKRIAELQSRREHYLEMATSISGMSENKIRSTDKRSRVETAALELVDLAAELGDQAAELVGALRAAERLLALLPQGKYRQLLSLRYLEALPWPEIIARMRFSDTDSAYHMHGWALSELRKAVRLQDGV